MRVVARSGRGRREMLLYQALALFLVACSAGYVLTPRSNAPTPPGDQPPTDGSAAPSAEGDARSDKMIAEALRDADRADAAAAGAVVTAPSRVTTGQPRSMTARRAAAPKAKAAEPDGDPTQDLSDFIPPDQAQDLTAGELIDELHKRGIYEGIGAFPPPGTNPPVAGLEVPDDFELPEGYVRYFQATDDGQRIRPILMFSPDFEFFDADGNRVQIPENRIVPPEMAPPGFPIHAVEMPPKRDPGALAR